MVEYNQPNEFIFVLTYDLPETQTNDMKLNDQHTVHPVRHAHSVSVNMLLFHGLLVLIFVIGLPTFFGVASLAL